MINKQKKYIVYTFPGLHGNPKSFKYYVSAFIYALFRSGVSELKNTETGEYKAYWGVIDV